MAQSFNWSQLVFFYFWHIKHKFGDALAVLDGDLGQQLEELTSHLDLVDNKKIEYLKKLDKWEQVYALALQLLQKRYENFEFWPKK